MALSCLAGTNPLPVNSRTSCPGKSFLHSFIPFFIHSIFGCRLILFRSKWISIEKMKRKKSREINNSLISAGSIFNGIIDWKKGKSHFTLFPSIVRCKVDSQTTTPCPLSCLFLSFFNESGRFKNNCFSNVHRLYGSKPFNHSAIIANSSLTVVRLRDTSLVSMTSQ